MTRLRDRFFPDMSESDAAARMSGVMVKSFGLSAAWTTYGYDMIQSVQQSISM